VTIASWVGVDPIGCICFPEMSVLDIFPDPQDVGTYVDLWKFPTFVTDPNCKKLNKVLFPYTCNTCLSINLSSKASLKGSLEKCHAEKSDFPDQWVATLGVQTKIPQNSLGIETYSHPAPKVASWNGNPRQFQGNPGWWNMISFWPDGWAIGFWNLWKGLVFFFVVMRWFNVHRCSPVALVYF